MITSRTALATAASTALTAIVLAGCTSGGSGSASSGSSGSSAAIPTPTTTVTVTPTATAAPATQNGIVGSSTPSAVATTSSEPTSHAPAPRSSDAISGFGAFVGLWGGHGRSLTIDKDGGFRLDFRTYTNCTATVTTGCDTISGNGITDGGHVRGMISHVYNPSTVQVLVFSSTDKKDVPVTTFTLGHDIRHHALAMRISGFTNAPFCGPGAPNGYCGA